MFTVFGPFTSTFKTFKGKKNPPALILKTSMTAPSYVDTHELKKRIDIIRNNVGETKLPNIYILSGDLSDIEMNSLYNHPKVKAHVSFTKNIPSKTERLIERTMAKK